MSSHWKQSSTSENLIEDNRLEVIFPYLAQQSRGGAVWSSILTNKRFNRQPEDRTFYFLYFWYRQQNKLPALQMLRRQNGEKFTSGSPRLISIKLALKLGQKTLMHLFKWLYLSKCVYTSRGHPSLRPTSFIYQKKEHFYQRLVYFLPPWYIKDMFKSLITLFPQPYRLVFDQR